MRVKILIFPLALAATIAIVIAYVWPEIGKVKKTKEGLAESQAAFQNIKEKRSNVESLERTLEQNKDKEAFVLSYLPVQNQEEEIINKLNQLAADSGVVLSMLSPEKEQAKAAASENTNEELSSKDALFSSSKEGTATAAGQEGPVLRATKIEVKVLGSYAAVKTFLEQVYKMEMFNNITSFSIAKEAEKGSQAEGEKPQNTDTLSAGAKIGFGYMSGTRLTGNYSAPVFSRSSFDFTPYDKLIQLVTKKIPALDVGSQGRANPFLP